ncbi:MAG: penicillin-binding protein 2 [Oscillospiraceae bacterium]|nr:penicillin-binding protein 2 [Oscillospiraceae bacterium]
MKKRMVSFFCVFLVIMGALILRVGKISGEGISKNAAALQSRRTLELSKTRAGIFDRNLEPLVNKNQKRRILVFPDILDLSVIGDFFDRDSLAEVFSKKEPSVLDTGGKIVEGAGIYNFSFPERYSENSLAVHVVGYMNGGKGVFGIEKSFEDFLSENGSKTTVSYYADGTGKLLSGEEILLDEEKVFEKSGVVLTLDSKIQKITEKALSKGVEKGAAVVMDVKNGEILACASFPEFEQDKIADYLDAENSPFINRAFSAYSVGSTWKIVVAAAALESGILPEKTFECTGKIEVEGKIYKCHWENGHGEIDMEKALEISCNPYFINLALETGGEKILETAKNLGFGSSVDFGENFSAAGGNLPLEEELSAKTVLASFAFGQGKLLATPVQLGVLASAVANGGKAVTPKIVLGTYDKNGIWSETPDYAANPVMSEKTAEILRKMMINVVEKGSGANAKPKNGSAGGKTASAQTGQFDENGSEIIHAWFIGFYPAEKPEFAVAVFAEGMDSGGDFAAPVFKSICDGIDLLNNN